MKALLQLLRELVARSSVTPEDAECQAFMIQELQRCGFVCETFDNFPVKNFFARLGTDAPLLVFAGHTDVVPVGDENQWHSPPFQLTEINGRLVGRGVADMKGSLAAMLHAVARFAADYPDFSGSLGFLITSGEEGDLFDQGTPYVMSELQKRGVKMDYCIVGEPSSTTTVGDVIKIGRRGSLTARLTLKGLQGHVAYPHLADNPIHRISPALAELTATQWDQGNAHFPPTTLQITQIQSGGQAGNIIPGELTLQFNCRFSTEQSVESLQKKILQIFQNHDLQPIIDWRVNGLPFLTAHGKLLDKVIQAIQLVAGLKPALSTSGGTSDGRFIAPFGVEVVEVGPVNASIHQVNEWIAPGELEMLEKIYYTLCHLLLPAA